jgi:Calcineurin-like phosphoesterase
MLHHRTAALALACTATLMLSTTLGVRLHGRQPQAPRLVAIGDIHGAGDAFVGILQATHLIGADRKWTGGTTTFVQTGDYLDRGGAARQVLDLLMDLEAQAKAAGGRAEILLGNHEVMNMLREVTDVSPEAYASFADASSEGRRRKAFDGAQGIAKQAKGAGDPGSRDAWMAAHPLGYVEYLDAMSPRGRYGKWMRAHKAAVQIGSTAFMHAGIAPDSRSTLDDVNRDVARAIKAWDDVNEILVRERLITPYFTLKETVAAAAGDLQRISADIEAGRPVDSRVTREYVDQLRGIIALGESPLLAGAGPMWFRGLSESPTEETSEQVTALFSRLGITRMVVGHTPRLPGRITPRFENRVFPIDTGMLSSFFKGGRASALEIVGDRVTAIYANEEEVLVGR